MNMRTRSLPEQADSGPQAGNFRRIWVAAAVIGAIVYAALASVIALDRAAPSDYRLRKLVPSAFRQTTLLSEIKQLADAGIPGSAHAQAQELVWRDPLGASSVAMLGNARLARGDSAGAQNAFRIAARLGWRDASTQVFWLKVALDAGDFHNASLRFDALARQWPHAAAVGQLAELFEGDPRGRLALAKRIAAGEPWGTSYARPDDAAPPARLAGRAGVLLVVAEQGMRLGCDRVAYLSGALAQHDPLLAAALWRSHCPRGAAFGALADGGFDQTLATAAPSPFAWSFPGDGALESMLIADAQGGQQLELRSAASTTLPVAVQRLALRPGAYRISWRSAADGPAAEQRLSASLGCLQDRANARPQPGSGVDGRLTVTLRFAGECPAPWLQLWLAPGAEKVQLDDIAITAKL